MVTPEFVLNQIICFSAFILGLFTIRKTRELLPVIVLLGLTLVSEIFSRYLAATIKTSAPPYHILCPIEIALWGVFFYRQIKNQTWRKICLVICIFGIGYSIYNSLFIQTLRTLPNNSLQLRSLILLTLGFRLFREKLDSPSDQKIFRDPIFIFTIAVIWFYLTSLLFVVFYEFIWRNYTPAELAKLGGILRFTNYTANYTYYILLNIAFFLTILKHRK